MSLTFTIRKTGDQWTNTKAWKEHLAALPDGRYKVTAPVPFKQRSLPQNAWLHAVLPDILKGLQDIGYNEIRTAEQAKAFIKSMFFRVTYTNGIDVVEVIQGTSETDKTDFCSKAEEIIIWADQYLGIDIAPPGAQTEIDLPAYVATYDQQAGVTIIEKA